MKKHPSHISGQEQQSWSNLSNKQNRKNKIFKQSKYFLSKISKTLILSHNWLPNKAMFFPAFLMCVCVFMYTTVSMDMAVRKISFLPWSVSVAECITVFNPLFFFHPYPLTCGFVIPPTLPYTIGDGFDHVACFDQ